MISNSVTHLWSYTNSAITDIAGNSTLISVAADHLKDCDNAAGIDDNSAEIGNNSAGIIYIAVKVIPC